MLQNRTDTNINNFTKITITVVDSKIKLIGINTQVKINQIVNLKFAKPQTHTQIHVK